MRDALFAVTAGVVCASLLAGCAGAPPAVRDAAVVDTRGEGPRAHLVLAEATVQKDPPTTIGHHPEGIGRDMGWFSIAVGAVGAGVALTTSALMLHQKSKRDAGCSAAKVCSEDGLNANEQISALAGWNVGAYAVAAVGLGLGAFLVLGNPESEKQTTVGVAPSGSGASLSLRSTF